MGETGFDTVPPLVRLDGSMIPGINRLPEGQFAIQKQIKTWLKDPSNQGSTSAGGSEGSSAKRAREDAPHNSDRTGGRGGGGRGGRSDGKEAIGLVGEEVQVLRIHSRTTSIPLIL